MQEFDAKDKPLELKVSNLSGRLFREGYLFDFFQAAHLLEGIFEEQGQSGTASTDMIERIRFRPHTGLAFPATDVRSIELSEGTPSRAVVTVTFMGLYGIDSPLPVYFYDSIATEAEQTKPLRDFLDIFNHRIYSLFYRAWKKYRPALHFKPAVGDLYTQQAMCLAGLGTKRIMEQSPVPPLHFAALAGRLLCRVRNAEGLRALIGDIFEDIGVSIQENVPRWVPISIRPHVGKGVRAPMTLGSTATIGERVFDISGKFRIEMGPLMMPQYLELLPEGKSAGKLQFLVRMSAPDHLDYDVRLVLRTDQITPLKLSDRNIKLGLTTWLGRPKREVTSRVVAYAA